MQGSKGSILFLFLLLCFIMIPVFADGQTVWPKKIGYVWEEIAPIGLNGDVDNYAVTSFVTFKNNLYVTTESYDPGTRRYIARIFRSTDGGFNWAQVATDGLDEDHYAIRLHVLGDYLFCASEDSIYAADLWRSVDGVVWEQVVSDGLGDPNNEKITGMAYHRKKYYVGTSNDTGGPEVWISGTGDPGDWRAVPTVGISGPADTSIGYFTVYKNRLVATLSQFATSQLYTSSNGSKWTPLMDMGDRLGPNFVFRGNLYSTVSGPYYPGVDLVCTNSFDYWPDITFDSNPSNNRLADNEEVMGFLFLTTENCVDGFGLYVSYWGFKNWVRELSYGLGDNYNFSAHLTSHNDIIYLGTSYVMGAGGCRILARRVPPVRLAVD